MPVLFAVARSSFPPPAVFTKAVSESLKSLINAAAAQDSSSSADRTADPSAAPAHPPPGSEATESKAAAADDVMVQITARKSEVGPNQAAPPVSCSRQKRDFPRALLFRSPVEQMNNQE